MPYKFFGNPLSQFFGGLVVLAVVVTAVSVAVGGWPASVIIGPVISGILPIFFVWMTIGEKLWYFRMWAFFNRKYRVVELLDYQGRITHALALKQPNSDKFTAFVHFCTRVGPLVLHENGLVTQPNHTESYIMFWQPYDKQDLMMWLLKGPLIDFHKVQIPPPEYRNAFLYIMATYRQAPKPW